MCGFVGFSTRQEPEQKQILLKKMADRIIHRGPDMDGYYADEQMGLGFRRLSIIDLSEAAAQPMYNEDRTVVVVGNGEIYNFMALREELEEKGHEFVSNSDIEVLAHGYEEYGEELPKKLRGMFAFVIWDTKKQTMLAARDPFGIKPFYYAPIKDNGLLFGSEIKCFLEHPDFIKEVNPHILRSYLTLQYAPGEETFFKGVYSLPQGYYFVWKDGIMRKECYWDVRFDDITEAGRFALPLDAEAVSMEQYADAIDKVVHSSVEAHRISDVEVGSFLSGGVDSSYITTCLMPEKTFSVGFEQDKFNETNYAAELSGKLGIKNYKKLVEADECFEAFPDIQYHMDQPQANPSSVPLWFLAKMAREEVTVVLSGEGADELFGGYELYADTPAMTRFKKLPLGLRRALGSIAYKLPNFKGRNFLLKCAERPEYWFVGQADVFPEKQAVKVLKGAYKTGPSAREIAAPFYERVADQSELDKKQYLDMHLWMPGDILLKADKMCMAHSLELRVPFLDKYVMYLAQILPEKYRVNGVQNKVAFRQAANKTLPDEWANRAKKGFPVPIRFWLQEEKYYKLVKEYFEAEYAAEFFEQDEIIKLLDEHYNKKKNNARKIWVIFTFLTWYKRFFVDEKAQPAAACDVVADTV